MLKLDALQYLPCVVNPGSIALWAAKTLLCDGPEETLLWDGSCTALQRSLWVAFEVTPPSLFSRQVTVTATSVSPCRNGPIPPVDRSSHLSPELWAHIFSLIGADICGLYGNLYPFVTIVDEIWVQQKQYRELQLVCKIFRDVFVAHPTLSEAVALPRVPQTALPCLLAWLRNQSSSVKVLASEGDYLDMALTSLIHATPPLGMLITCGATPRAMAVLPIFTSLQLCDLTAPDTDTGALLDLLPLQALPNLQHLKLQQGKFANLHAAAYLTNLAIVGSTVRSRQDCLAAGSLRQLSVKGSTMVAFHSLGVCACTALEWLDIQDSVICSTQGDNTLHLKTAYHDIPASITSLTSLDDITIQAGFEQSYDWLYELTTLTALRFRCYSRDNYSPPLTLSDRLTRLQRLQILDVSGVLLSTNSCAPTLDLQVDWELMHHLSQVRFMGQIIACDVRILQLAWANLTALEFHECMPGGTVSMRNMVLLAHRAAVHNPNMAFLVDGL